MSYDSQTAIKNRHDFDSTFTNEYDGDQTATTIITPTSGYKIKVTSAYISSEDATTVGQRIKLHFATSGNTVATLFPGAVDNQTSAIAIDKMLVTGATDEVLKLTANIGADRNYFILVNYKEEI